MGVMGAAAAAAMDACGIEPAVLEKAIREFEALPHRMQEVADIEGVRFVDDSKATNLSAMKAGLEMSPSGVRLIAGGLLKEDNLKTLKELLANKVLTVYLVGTAGEKMMKAWEDVVRCVRCEDLANAVASALRDSSSGETVLLSPGCSSFDQFADYEDRGNQFSLLVEKIGQGELK